VIDLHACIEQEIKTLNNGNQDPQLHLAIPSKQLIYDRVHEADPYGQHRAKKGEQSATRTFNYGGSINVPNYIGSRVESDTQIIDVMVWDENLGLSYRPYLTAFIDCHTSCILGYDLSAEGPSADKTMRALAQSMSYSETHPYRCVPRVIYVDN